MWEKSLITFQSLTDFDVIHIKKKKKSKSVNVFGKHGVSGRNLQNKWRRMAPGFHQQIKDTALIN